jgi:FkbM family methyltransferase
VVSAARVRETWARLRARARHRIERPAHRPAPRLVGPELLREFAELQPEAFFVEVGSNDGDSFDHLRSHILQRRWRGVMVEPIPHVFDRLQRNYAANERIALEHAAVSSNDGMVSAYYLAPLRAAEGGTMPHWYDAVASLSRDMVLAQGASIPGVEQRLREVEVPALTFDSLCRKHGIEQLDLLVVDTEGHDFEVLSGVDFAALRPRLVVYEHLHLGEQRAGCRALLGRAGYEVMEEGFDTWCLDTSIEDSLTALWRRLEPEIPGISSEQWEQYRLLIEAADTPADA